jgi:hypothetical protein
MAQFKASDKDWQGIENASKHEFLGATYPRTILELRDRVAALEGRGELIVGLEVDTTVPTPPAAVPSNEELWNLQLAARMQAKPDVGWQEWHYGAGKAPIAAHRALYDHGFQHGLAAGRAEHGGAPEHEPVDPQTLHSVALGHVDSLGRSFNLLPEILDTLRRAIREPMAEQQVATEESSAAQSDPQVLFSVTLAGSNAIRWEEVINALTIAEAKLFDLWEYSKGIGPWCLPVADTAYPAYRAVHDMLNECRRTGATGAIGNLASPPPITPSPEPTHPPYISGHGLICSEIERELVAAGWPEPDQAPAGDGGLVKEVLDAMGEGIEADVEARASILAVAKWLEKYKPSGHETEPTSADFFAYVLRQEANR